MFGLETTGEQLDILPRCLGQFPQDQMVSRWRKMPARYYLFRGLKEFVLSTDDFPLLDVLCMQRMKSS